MDHRRRMHAERHHVGASTVGSPQPACWRYVLLPAGQPVVRVITSVAWRGLAGGRWPLYMHACMHVWMSLLRGGSQLMSRPHAGWPPVGPVRRASAHVQYI